MQHSQNTFLFYLYAKAEHKLYLIHTEVQTYFKVVLLKTVLNFFIIKADQSDVCRLQI